MCFTWTPEIWVKTHFGISVTNCSKYTYFGMWKYTKQPYRWRDPHVFNITNSIHYTTSDLSAKISHLVVWLIYSNVGNVSLKISVLSLLHINKIFKILKNISKPLSERSKPFWTFCRSFANGWMAISHQCLCSASITWSVEWYAVWLQWLFVTIWDNQDSPWTPHYCKQQTQPWLSFCSIGGSKHISW